MKSKQRAATWIVHFALSAALGACSGNVDTTAFDSAGATTDPTGGDVTDDAFDVGDDGSDVGADELGLDDESADFGNDLGEPDPSTFVDVDGLSDLGEGGEVRGEGPVDKAQPVFVGHTVDRCSGSLSVVDRFNRRISVPRGTYVTVDVAIDSGDYWHWFCGNTAERSREGSRVKQLVVLHSTSSRRIDWWAYDLLP